MMKRLLGLLMLMGVLVGTSGCGKEIEVWKEEYSKDKVKEEYQYYHHLETNRRMKDGWYNSYYENGGYKEVGTYKDNERDGEWTYFTADGKETKVSYTVDGGFIITGYDFFARGYEYSLLLKTDGLGNEDWRKTFGKGGGNSVQQTVEGGFIVTGEDYADISPDR